MPAITITPPSAVGGTTFTVTGSGFTPGQRLKMTVDGYGATTNRFRSDKGGTFVVGISTGTGSALGTHTVQILADSTSTLLSQGTFQIVSVAPPPGDPAFLTRPASGPINRSGGAAQTVENIAINGGTRDSVAGIGISIANVNGTVTIRNVDLANLVGGIYIYGCTGTLLIENVRSRNIGDGTIGSGHSNHIQLANCSFSGAIRGNRFLAGRTEDMISTWHSGGRGAGQELVIEQNHLQGLVADTATARAWTSSSGTGIIISDGAGDPHNGNIIVRRNKLLTPGQVGIQHIDGPNIQTYENIIYGEQRPGNNNPITSWEGNPRGVIRDNRYYWTKEDGSHPDPWMHMNPSGMQLTNNIEDPNIDVAALRIVL